MPRMRPGTTTAQLPTPDGASVVVAVRVPDCLNCHKNRWSRRSGGAPCPSSCCLGAPAPRSWPNSSLSSRPPGWPRSSPLQADSYPPARGVGTEQASCGLARSHGTAFACLIANENHSTSDRRDRIGPRGREGARPGPRLGGAAKYTAPYSQVPATGAQEDTAVPPPALHPRPGQSAYMSAVTAPAFLGARRRFVTGSAQAVHR
jgi:hypothetical protein